VAGRPVFSKSGAKETVTSQREQVQVFGDAEGEFVTNPV
jgi:hypothetical protein